MAYQKDRFFYKKIVNFFTYKKTNIPRLAQLVLMEFAKHCDKDGFGEVLRGDIGKKINITKPTVSRFTRGFESLNIMTKTKQYQKGSQNMKQNKFQIHLDIMLELSMGEDGKITIDHKPFVYQRTPVNIDENACTNNVTQSHGDTTPQSHGETVKLRSTSKEETKKEPTPLKIVHAQILTSSDSQVLSLPVDHYFEDFWATYPRKEKKVEARRIWIREKLDSIAEKIIEDLRQRQVRHDRWEDRKFIPYPTTYLNDEGWNDEIIERRKSTKNESGSEPGSIRSYAEQLLRVTNKLSNVRHVRSVQNNMGGKVD
jgi:hypothetical protein